MRISLILLSLHVSCSAAWCASRFGLQRVPAQSASPRRVPAEVMLAKKQRPSARKKRPAARGFAEKPKAADLLSPEKSEAADPEGAPPEFSPLPRMTHVVHMSPSLKTSETDGEKAVLAAQHVTAGEVLLVEHCVTGEPEYVLNCVLNDGSLFDVLYPRTKSWSVEQLLADELEPMVVEKVDSNGFAASDGTVALGSAVSAFNHAAPPQAVVRSLSLATEDMAIAPRVLYVLAVADVAAGEEIRIEYRDSPSALHPYVQPETAEAEAAPAADLQAGAEKARAIIMEYTKTEAFVNLCVAHDRLYRSLL